MSNLTSYIPFFIGTGLLIIGALIIVNNNDHAAAMGTGSALMLVAVGIMWRHFRCD